jgi:hypothetical protein
MFNNSYGISFFTDLGGKDPGNPTKDNWVIGNHFDRNSNGISLGGAIPGNGAMDNLLAENKITGNQHGWWCNKYMVGNHVLTSDTTDDNYLEGSKYCAGAQHAANVSFFHEPPAQK